MLDMPAAASALSDYSSVRRTIEFMASRRRERPSIEEIAEAAGLSVLRLEQVFERWAGLTTKSFLQTISVDRARELLRDSAAALDGARPVGLSGPGARAICLQLMKR